MKARKVSPPDYLQNCVRYFWILENPDMDASPKVFAPIADGCPGLLFQLSGKGTFQDPSSKVLPNIFLYGQTTRPTQLQATGSFRTIGVFFYPDALSTVFGFQADDLTNTCFDLNSEQQGIYLLERLFDCATVSEQLELLSFYLFDQIKRHEARVDKKISYALSQIKQSIPLKNLQDDLGWSERSFERKFKQSVGISPKLYSRICRFQSSLNQLRNKDFSKFSDIVFDNDYADQSHFIRVFKEFTGFSPQQYLKHSNEMIENFPELHL